MPTIHVPRPSKDAMNPDRPLSSLLLTQIQHLQHAERRLPLMYRTKIYTHAIRTEGEAARYIREVTEAIHQAHADSADQRVQDAGRRKRVLDTAIAAAAESRPRKPRAKTKSKSTKSKSTKSKSKIGGTRRRKK